MGTRRPASWPNFDTAERIPELRGAVEVGLVNLELRMSEVRNLAVAILSLPGAFDLPTSSSIVCGEIDGLYVSFPYLRLERGRVVKIESQDPVYGGIVEVSMRQKNDYPKRPLAPPIACLRGLAFRMGQSSGGTEAVKVYQAGRDTLSVQTDPSSEMNPFQVARALLTIPDNPVVVQSGDMRTRL